jgi:hypothetical protein
MHNIWLWAASAVTEKWPMFAQNEDLFVVKGFCARA